MRLIGSLLVQIKKKGPMLENHWKEEIFLRKNKFEIVLLAYSLDPRFGGLRFYCNWWELPFSDSDHFKARNTNIGVGLTFRKTAREYDIRKQGRSTFVKM